MKFTKLFILSLLTLLLFTSTSNGQVKLALGLEGGINISNVNTTPSASTDSRIGLIAGGILDIGITPTIGITTGLRYIMKGWETTANGVTYKDKINYLEFPALLKVKFPMTEIKPYLIGGPTLGVNVSAMEEQSNGVQTVDVDVSNSVESIDFGLLFGAGLDFGLGAKSSIFVQGAYQLGLSNILKSGTSTIKNYGIQITGGVKFNL